MPVPDIIRRSGAIVVSFCVRGFRFAAGGGEAIKNYGLNTTKIPSAVRLIDAGKGIVLLRLKAISQLDAGADNVRFRLLWTTRQSHFHYDT